MLIPLKLHFETSLHCNASTQTTEQQPVTIHDLNNLQAVMLMTIQTELRALLIGLGF
jgi:hypothetical protein